MAGKFPMVKPRITGQRMGSKAQVVQALCGRLPLVRATVNSFRSKAQLRSKGSSKQGFAKNCLSKVYKMGLITSGDVC